MTNDTGAGWYYIRDDGNGAVVLLFFGYIASRDEELFNELRDIRAPKTLDVFVNSWGGDLFTAMAIHDRLRTFARGGCTVRAHVDGIAASGAALVACAASTVTVSADAFVMHHEPRYLDGSAPDARLEAMREGMARRIAEDCGRERTEIADLMRGGRWLNAAETVSAGLATELCVGVV